MTTNNTGALFHQDLTYPYPTLERGQGIYLWDDTGKRYIDGGAGATNVTLGHGRRRIVDAMADQGAKLAFCFSAHFTHQPALDLASRVAALAPGDLNHVYFVSGGSEGIEVAFKIARQFHLQRGNQSKHLVIGRWGSYHGATLGALSATGLPPLRKAFAPLLCAFPHIAPCYPYRCSLPGCQGRCSLACARQLEEAILQAGPENVAAFVAEPIVQGSIAVAQPPPEYFPLIREICDRYEVLFIADEIITGWGRTGKYFAMEHWDVVPDMIVFAKGISSGYCPLGGVLLRDHIRDSFASSGENFAHIFTYVNNPVAMRAGLAVLDILEEEDILEHVCQVGAYLRENSQQLRSHSIVGEIRSQGLMMGLELVPDATNPAAFAPELQVKKRLGRILLEKGLSLGVGGGGVDGKTGDDLRLAPPLIITREQIDQVLQILDESIAELQTQLAK